MSKSRSSLRSLSSLSHALDEYDIHDHVCGNCGKSFLTSHQLRSHSSAKSECRRWMKSKAPDLDVLDAVAEGKSDETKSKKGDKAGKKRVATSKTKAKDVDKGKGKGKEIVQNEEEPSLEGKGRRKRRRVSPGSEGRMEDAEDRDGEEMSAGEGENGIPIVQEEMSARKGDEEMSVAQDEMTEVEVEMDAEDVQQIFMDMDEEYQQYVPHRPTSPSHSEAQPSDSMDVDEPLASSSRHPIPSSSAQHTPSTPKRTTSIRLDDEEDIRVIDDSDRGGEDFGPGEGMYDSWHRRLRDLAKEMQERENIRAERVRRRREEMGLDEEADEEIEMWEDNEWAPFRTKLDWEIAKWAIEEGIGKGSIDRLLKIPGVRIRLPVISINTDFKIRSLNV